MKAPQFSPPEWADEVARFSRAVDVARAARDAAEDAAKGAEDKASRLVQVTLALLTRASTGSMVGKPQAHRSDAGASLVHPGPRCATPRWSCRGNLSRDRFSFSPQRSDQPCFDDRGDPAPHPLRRQAVADGRDPAVGTPCRPGPFRALGVPNRAATQGHSRPHAVSAPRTIIQPDAVDSPDQVGSQADSAGSIPVTRSKHEKRCSSWGFVKSIVALSVGPAHPRAPLDDQWAIRGPQAPMSHRPSGSWS